MVVAASLVPPSQEQHHKEEEENPVNLSSNAAGSQPAKHCDDNKKDEETLVETSHPKDEKEGSSELAMDIGDAQDMHDDASPHHHADETCQLMRNTNIHLFHWTTTFFQHESPNHVGS
jgi:hypothetical protein